MAFDKAKTLKSAEKFLSQGKINAAIKEYRQVVDNDEEDLTALNMLGDLCVRAEKKDDAISCFLKIAEHYREQEFTLKAIAMYKKVDKLKPADPEIAHKLATLYSAQGLVVDARAQYLIVADACTRAGETKRALQILHKIADLDPNNTEIRLKLAAGYIKEGLISDAADAFIEAGARLFECGEFEKSLDCYSRTLQLRPDDIVALKGMVSAYVALGSADEAAEILERAIEQRPEDFDLVSMLAQAYLDAENPKGAERVTSQLMAHDASNYIRFIAVASLYLKCGEVDEAVRILANITEQMLTGREENDLLELVNEVLARDPEQITALRLLVRIHWWQRDMDKLRAALERLAEAGEAAGLIDEERYALTQLVRLAPDEQRYLERLNSLGGLQEEKEERSIAESGLTGVPSFETFAIDANELAAGSPAGAEVNDSVSDFEWNSVEEQTVTDPSASFAELNEAIEGAEANLDTPGSSSGAEFDLSGTTPREKTTTKLENPPTAAGEFRRDSIMHQELESVDFYISQGYVDIALDTLEMLERQFGSQAEIEFRREKLKSPSQAAADLSDVFEFGSADQLLQQQSETMQAPGETVAFAREDTEAPAAVRSYTADDPARFRDSKGIDAGLAEVFEEFRVAAEEDQESSNEDYETHYNMGTAYKEMDLLDEAIQEFQTAAGLVKSDAATSSYLQCCNMLGHCFIRKGFPQAAVAWFKRGLNLPGHTEDEYQALRYELGSAYEQMGELDRALDMFTEVYGLDVSYRDVAEKLRELQVQESGAKREQGKNHESWESRES